MANAAVVLLSGGLDSATTLAVAMDDGFEAYALSFDYGQRHRIELEAARRVAQSLRAKAHTTCKIDNRIFAGSALTDDIEVPKSRTDFGGIPVTYVPARNTIFLAHALAYAESVGARDIFMGVNALDYSGYPDCRPEFIRAFEQMANLGTKSAKFKIHAPLIDMTKAQIIRRAAELHVDLALTHSCYDPTADGLACGWCDSCQLRRKGFREAGVTDPIKYTS